MLGSTFVHAPDASKLALIAEDMDSIDDFDHVDLDRLLALDFELICSPAGIEWCAKEPAVFDEEGGLAIPRVNPDALRHIIARKHDLGAEQVIDVERLEEFGAEFGFDHLYQVSTF